MKLLLGIETVHIFIWLFLVFLLSKNDSVARYELVQGKALRRFTPVFSTLVFLPIIMMAAFGRVRYDTFAYLSSFHDLTSKMSEGIKQAFNSKSPGFLLFGVAIKSIFGENETACRLAIALIHAIPVIAVFRHYSDDYIFSVYLFVASGNHLAWMMNGLRQFIAVAIIFAATPWIVEKRYFRVILVVLLASSFHRTALFMLPVVFIVQGEAWGRKTFEFIFVAILTAFIFSRNAQLFDNVADTVGYSVEAAKSWGDDGAHPLRVLVSAVPLILAYLARQALRRENNNMINMCINMSAVTVGINLVAMVTSGIMTGRMAIYTGLYNLILLPHVIMTYFNDQDATLVNIIAVVLYFLYYYVQWGV